LGFVVRCKYQKLLLDVQIHNSRFNEILCFFTIQFLTEIILTHTLVMLKNGKGSIINNSSIQGVNSQRNVSAYAATKGAIISLTRQLACEYGVNNIRVNTVSPGSVQTPLMAANTGNLDYVKNNTPLNRLGVPDDIAQMVLFLASNKSSWITGQNLCVDGGITIKGGWAKLSHDDQ
jgi:meso-butanediol dehydrogenase/(S,S)-butanediol dehydrogenase/diacetyl reductase